MNFVDFFFGLWVCSVIAEKGHLLLIFSVLGRRGNEKREGKFVWEKMGQKEKLMGPFYLGDVQGIRFSAIKVLIY